MTKVNMMLYVLRAFRSMGASKTQIVKEAVTCAKDPQYLGSWYDFLSGDQR